MTDSEKNSIVKDFIRGKLRQIDPKEIVQSWWDANNSFSEVADFVNRTTDMFRVMNDSKELVGVEADEASRRIMELYEEVRYREKLWKQRSRGTSEHGTNPNSSTVRNSCPICNGSGKEDCYYGCGGSGRIIIAGIMKLHGKCGGTGKAICRRCNGTGFID